LKAPYVDNPLSRVWDCLRYFLWPITTRLLVAAQQNPCTLLRGKIGFKLGEYQDGHSQCHVEEHDHVAGARIGGNLATSGTGY
jgi:hypothetical protein